MQPLSLHRIKKHGRVKFFASIKQVIDKVADKRIQGVNIAPQVLPIGYFIRDEMRDHQYQLTLAQRTVLFDLEGMAEAIANKYISGIPSF